MSCHRFVRSIFMLFSILNAAEFPHEVVIDTSKTVLPLSLNYTSEAAEELVTTRMKVWKKLEYHIDYDFFLIFRVLHKDMVPVWLKIAKDFPDNEVIKVMVINAFTSLKDPSFLPQFAHMKESKNPIVREYVANAYSTLGSKEHIPMLKKWHDKESNGYVQKTILASIKKIETGKESDRIKYLPYLCDLPFPTVYFFFNRGMNTREGLFWGEYNDDIKIKVAQTDKVVYPHQMFQYSLKDAPKVNFGTEWDSGVHVGEDSGWFLEGLPVHSVADGLVRMIQHETSWGNIIVIESNIHGSPVTHLYGHLGETVDVSVGDVVKAGDKIGVIGRSVSIENGGYWAHTHVGIQRSNYAGATITGYAKEKYHFISMKQLIEQFNDTLIISPWDLMSR